jgi:uncharacterized protein
MLAVDWTQQKGRGAFAERRFLKGELIERAPIVVVPTWQWYYVEKTWLVNHCFLWGDEMAIAFGHFSIFNHSYCPNACYVKRLDDRIIEIVALRDIEAGEEIVANYNGLPDDDTPVWFEVKD